MENIKVPHINGGTGENSYQNNSTLQRKVISMTKAIREKAISDAYSNISFNSSIISIADLGCSSGPNTYLVGTEALKTVDELRRKLRRKSSPEYQIYLNDLPGNDFNSIFRTLPQIQEKLREEMGSGFGPCFFNGVPGSFYGRLFPTSTLHFVHSSYSLHWLSQVPSGVEMNEENICVARTSPPSVIRAYYEQFQKDFSTFLKCRSEELVNGGRMVLTILGRENDDHTSKNSCYIYDVLTMVLKQLVSEGLIEQKKLLSFYVPVYMSSPFEVKAEIQKAGSFTINCLETSEIEWAASADEFSPSNSFKDRGYSVAKCMRSVSEPLMIDHFGESLMDIIFQRYGEILGDCMSKEETKYVNITVSLTKHCLE